MAGETARKVAGGVERGPPATNGTRSLAVPAAAVDPQWFTETVHWNVEQRLLVKERLYKATTRLGQKVEVLDTDLAGRVFVLDGAVQCSERDEFYYHEMLVHVPLSSLGRLRRVAIVGGASGATAREVLKHPVADVSMIEIDRENVELCRRFLPDLHGRAFDDPRLTLRYGDAAEVLMALEPGLDAIIVDGPDPVGLGEALFTESFYRLCRDRLGPNGLLVSQLGVPFVQESEFLTAAARLRRVFAAVGGFRAAVPLFIGGDMVFALACQGGRPWDISRSQLEGRLAERGLSTGYYNAAMHMASLALPNSIAAVFAP